jgi:MFS family permease
MATIESTGFDLSDIKHSVQLRRAVVAGTVGTIIEAYDFLLYVQVAPLVFATLLLTGLSTFAVGFVPGYASVGIWGAVILTVLRFIQGMGIGGEWGGATLIAMEWAKTN